MSPLKATATLLTLLVVAWGAAHASDDWPQFGGPDRNFVAPTETPRAWPEAGPEVLWRRDLGEGYSSVARAGDRLFTIGAMNMETAFYAELDGTVEKVVSPSSTRVEAHDLVLVIAPE